MLYRIKESKDSNRELNIVINLYAVEFYTYNFSENNIVDVKIYTCNNKIIEVILTEKAFNDFENAMNTLFGKPINHTFGQSKKD